MNKLKIMILAGVVLLTAVAPALAFGPLDVDAGLALKGKYVWRGQVYSPDTVLQPEVGIGILGFSAGFWGNMDTSDANGTEMQFQEVDYTLGYEFKLPKLSFGAGFTHYSYPNLELDSTTEFFLSAELGILLSPSLTFYQDIDAVKGAYWAASISHGVALSPSMDLDLTAGVGLGSQGYIEGYFGPATLLPAVPEVPGNAAMTDYYLTAGIPFHPVPMFTVTPSVTYSSLTGDVKDIVDAAEGAAYHGDSDAFVWALSATFSF